jgi:hypothetical protein
LKQISHLSVSSLKLHAYSPAKWALTYLEGLREPATEHLKFGERVHSILEKLQADPNDLSVAGRHKGFFSWFLLENKNWFNSEGWRLEEKFHLWLDPRLPPFTGRIDMFKCDDSGLLVVDHKTATQGFELSEEDLKKDWQLSLYAYALDPLQGYKTKVAHNQLFKQKNRKTGVFDLAGQNFQQIDLNLEDRTRNMAEIRDEAFSVLNTVKQYEAGGLEAVDIGQAQELYYNKDDYHWPLISKQISLGEFKQSLGGN